MEFEKCKLRDIADVMISGVDKKSNNDETPVRLCNFVDVYRNWAITSSLHDTFMQATAKQIEIDRFLLHKGQVAITKDSETRNDIGIATYIADDFDDVILGYHCALITPNNELVDSKYLNAFLHSNYILRYFELNATGSGMRYTLSNDTILNMPILLPAIEQQKAIGRVFSNIDKQIETLNSINRNLEQVARQLYDYWFVQFDFPNSEGKPYKSSGGNMAWNEQLKAYIPREWSVSCLEDVFDIIMDRCSNAEQHTHYTPIEVIPRKQMSLNETAPIENAISGLCSYKKNDILLSNRRVYFHKVCIAPFDGITRDTVIVLRPKQSSYLGFLFQLVFSEHFISYATLHSYGSEQPVLSWQTVKRYKFATPDVSLIRQYCNLANDIINQVIDNHNQIRHLKSLRDELLPMLLNGQVNCDLSQ